MVLSLHPKQQAMSYHILYNKQFIKVDANHVIPFYLGGDNNVTVGHGRNEKRARDWGNSFAHTMGNIIVSNVDLLANIDQYREQTMKRAAEQVEQYDESWAYDDKRWGYHTSVAIYGNSTRGTSFNAYKAFYANGIKNAMTIEELLERGVTISIAPYYWKEEDILNKGLEIKERVRFSSTEHMVATIKEYTEYYNNHGVSLYLNECGMNYHMERKKTENLHKKYQRNNQKVSVTVQEYYVLEMLECSGAFLKNTARGMSYSHDYRYGKAFMTEKEVNKFHKNMKNKNRVKPKKVVGYSRTFYTFAPKS